MSRNKTRDFWEAAWANERRSPRTSYAMHLIRDENVTGKDVLEIGCGDLYSSWCAAEAAKRYVGIDIASSPLGLVRRDYPKHLLVEADAITLPFRDRSFDAVISIHTFTLLGRGIANALEEVRRVLRGDGSLMFNVTHTDIVAYYNPGSGLAGIRGEPDYGTFFPPTWGNCGVITYDDTGIRRQVEEAGFDVKYTDLFTDYEYSILGIPLYEQRPKGEGKTDDIKAEIFVSALKR